jgi:sulfur carrier protein
MTTTETRLREMTVNGSPIASAAGTLADLVIEQGYADAKVATALNGEFVPARRRAETSVADGDRIEILSARQGG